jgi:hypothetical protein
MFFFLPSRYLAAIGEYMYRHMGGIYEINRSNGFRCHDMYTKFSKDWFSHSKDARGGGGGGETRPRAKPEKQTNHGKSKKKINFFKN